MCTCPKSLLSQLEDDDILRRHYEFMLIQVGATVDLPVRVQVSTLISLQLLLIGFSGHWHRFL